VNTESGLEQLTRMANGYHYIQSQRNELATQVKKIRRQNVCLRVLLLVAVALIVLRVWL
jgi:hypothetical protein